MIDDPPFLSESDVFEDGGPDDEQRFGACSCKENFIPVNRLSMANLPKGCRHPEYLKRLRSICDRTVKIRLGYTSPNRPETFRDSTAPYPHAEDKGTRRGRCGTGFICYMEPRLVTGESCPCPQCRDRSGNDNSKTGYFKVSVQTAAHVVYDDREAARTICEVFYDSADDGSVKSLLYGVKGRGWWWGRRDDDVNDLKERCDDDWYVVDCVSHDMALYRRLQNTLEPDYGSLYAIPAIVSHAHGASKRVSFGTRFHLSITFNETHTPDTYYVMPAGTRVATQHTDVDMTSQYPEFFRKDTSTPTTHDDTDTLCCYSTTRDLRLCGFTPDSWQCMTIPCPVTSTYRVHLPENTHVTSPDGSIQFPVETFQFLFYAYDLLEALRPNIQSYHYTYDIHTCKGSSGGYVPAILIPKHPVLLHHAGKETNGINRTGLNKP